jgi:hypothetical protein
MVRVTAGSLCGACLQGNFGASKSRFDWCAHHLVGVRGSCSRVTLQVVVFLSCGHLAQKLT